MLPFVLFRDIHSINDSALRLHPLPARGIARRPATGYNGAMQTLIFNGSPRPHGDTTTLLDALCNRLQGDAIHISAYRDGIGPCVDCRSCWRQPGCAIQDGMQAVYRHIETCDNLIVASPVYFSELTGPLLSVFSRLQTYFAARYFRQDPPQIKRKRGVLILVGGEPGTDRRAAETAHTVMRLMRTDIVAGVRSMHTNERPAADDPEALAQALHAADLLNTNG